MNRICILTVFWLSVSAVTGDTNSLNGAWLEKGVKWTKVPPDVSPNHRQWAQVSILYFDRDGKFGLIQCTVNREPKRISISAGDPRGIFKGTWNASGPTIAVKYQLVEATILPVGEKLPRPMKDGTVGVSDGSALTFEGKTYCREPALDNSAAEAMYGIRKPRR